MKLLKNNCKVSASALIGTGAVLGLLLSAVTHWPPGVVEMRAGAEEKPTLASEATNAPSVPSTIRDFHRGMTAAAFLRVTQGGSKPPAAVSVAATIRDARNGVDWRQHPDQWVHYHRI